MRPCPFSTLGNWVSGDPRKHLKRPLGSASFFDLDSMTLSIPTGYPLILRVSAGVLPPFAGWQRKAAWIRSVQHQQLKLPDTIEVPLRIQERIGGRSQNTLLKATVRCFRDPAEITKAFTNGDNCRRTYPQGLNIAFMNEKVRRTTVSTGCSSGLAEELTRVSWKNSQHLAYPRLEDSMSSTGLG